MELIDRLRMAQVKRYPISHTSREQSVAEHSFGVVLITMDLMTSVKDEDLRMEAVNYAVIHDAEEVYTGDIPSSFKRTLRAHFPGAAALLDGMNPTPVVVKSIVKLADYLEAIYFLREFGGSRLSQNVVLRDIEANFKTALEKFRETYPDLWPISDRASDLWGRL